MRENNRKPQQKTDYTSGDNAHRYSLLLIGMACNFCSDTPVFHLRRPDHGPYRVQLYMEYAGVTEQWSLGQLQHGDGILKT